MSGWGSLNEVMRGVPAGARRNGGLFGQMHPKVFSTPVRKGGVSLPPIMESSDTDGTLANPTGVAARFIFRNEQIFNPIIEVIPVPTPKATRWPRAVMQQPDHARRLRAKAVDLDKVSPPRRTPLCREPLLADHEELPAEETIICVPPQKVPCLRLIAQQHRPPGKDRLDVLNACRQGEWWAATLGRQFGGVLDAMSPH